MRIPFSLRNNRIKWATEKVFALIFLFSVIVSTTARAAADDTRDMFMAVEKNNLPQLKAFLRENPSLANIKKPWGETVLMHAIAHGNKSIVDYLISQGADIHAKNCADRGALWYAIMDRFDIMNELLSMGLDVNAKDSIGMTVLMMACLSNRVKMTQLLISKGADVNAQDYDGLTALIHVADGSKIELAKILIANGADLNMRVHSGELKGKTALGVAIRIDYKALIALLRKHGAKE
jgi:ankyrin repeat protein